MFFIGPWHYYSELKWDDENGTKLKDNISSLVSAAWDDKKITICLEGRIDGQNGNIFIEINSQDTEILSLGDYQINSTFRRVLALKRYQYHNSCTPSFSNSYILKKINNGLSKKYYDKEKIIKEINSNQANNYFILFKSNDEGVNIYNNYFGIYKNSNSNNKMVWFAPKGVYHKEIDANSIDYTWALIKDVVTMPYQWFAMFVYVSGGIG